MSRTGFLLSLFAAFVLAAPGCGGGGSGSSGAGSDEHEHGDEHAHDVPDSLDEVPAAFKDLQTELKEAFDAGDGDAVDHVQHEAIDVVVAGKKLADGLEDRYQSADVAGALDAVGEAFQLTHAHGKAERTADEYEGQKQAIDDAIAKLEETLTKKEKSEEPGEGE